MKQNVTYLIWMKNNDSVVKKCKFHTFWSISDLIYILGHYGFIFGPMTKKIYMLNKGIISFKMTPHLSILDENWLHWNFGGIIFLKSSVKGGKGQSYFNDYYFCNLHIPRILGVCSVSLAFSDKLLLGSEGVCAISGGGRFIGDLW